MLLRYHPLAFKSQAFLYTERTGLSSACARGRRPLSCRPSWQWGAGGGAGWTVPVGPAPEEPAPFACVKDSEPLWNDLKAGACCYPICAQPSASGPNIPDNFVSGAANWGPTTKCFLWPVQCFTILNLNACGPLFFLAPWLPIVLLTTINICSLVNQSPHYL